MPKILNYSDLIQESEEVLLLLEKARLKSYLRDRLRFLRFLKTWYCQESRRVCCFDKLEFSSRKKIMV